MTAQAEIANEALEIPMTQGYEAFVQQLESLDGLTGSVAVAAIRDRGGVLSLMGGTLAPEVHDDTCQLLIPAVSTTRGRVMQEHDLLDLSEQQRVGFDRDDIEVYTDIESRFLSKERQIEALTGHTLDIAIGSQAVQQRLLDWRTELPIGMTMTAASHLWSYISVMHDEADLPEWTDAIQEEREMIIDTIVDVMCVNGTMRSAAVLMAQSAQENRLVVDSPQDLRSQSSRSDRVASTREIGKLQKLGMDSDSIMRTLLERMGIYFA